MNSTNTDNESNSTNDESKLYLELGFTKDQIVPDADIKRDMLIRSKNGIENSIYKNTNKHNISVTVNTNLSHDIDEPFYYFHHVLLCINSSKIIYYSGDKLVNFLSKIKPSAHFYLWICKEDTSKDRESMIKWINGSKPIPNKDNKNYKNNNILLP